LEKKTKVLDWGLDGKLDEDEMMRLNEKYNKEVAELKSRIAEINERNSFIENAKANIENTIGAMRKITNQEVCAPELYAEIIDKILLYDNYALDIYFKSIKQPVCLSFSTSGRGRTYRVECKQRQTA